MTAEDENRQLAQVCDRVVQEFAGRMPPEIVRARFDEIVAGFEGNPIRTFVPVLVQRQLRRALTST